MATYAPPVYVIPNNNDVLESLLSDKCLFRFSVILLSLGNKLIGSTSLIEYFVTAILLCEDRMFFVW
jgi:hypothetical protein